MSGAFLGKKQRAGVGGSPRARGHPTWGGVPVQQAVVLGGVEVHDDAGSIQQLLVAAGAGNAVVAVAVVAPGAQLCRLHLATQ